MTSRAHRPSDPVSVAKIGLYAAIVTAVGTVGVAAVNHFSGTGGVETKVTSVSTASTSPSTKSDTNPYKVVYNEAGVVTVSGHADQDVDGVAVVVGPKPAGGYWVGFSNVFNQQWQTDIATEPQIQQENIPIVAIFHKAGVDPVKPAGFRLTTHGTETPPPPPSPKSQITECAQRSGVDCFKGPGWEPPSVYQPDK